MKLLLTILIVSCSFCSIHCSKSHPITTLLNAKWSITPVSLEVAEYLFDENPALFWDYVEALNHLETPLYKIDGDSKLYKSAIKAAEKLIGPTYLPLLKLSLSMHTTSPRIQAHFQIANDVIAHGDCNTGTFVTIGNRVACNMNELKKGLERVEANSDEEIYSFDHIYPGSENNTVTTVLYSEIGTEDFHKFHEFLKKEALNGKVKYVSRHFVKNLTKEKVRLSGYGVELHLKSTEYKSQDDSPRVDDVTEAPSDVDMQVDGFDFKRLKERYASLAHSLDRFRVSLSEKTDEIALLKAWEFQELGLQAAERVAAIQGEEALQILQFTSQNFPTQAKSLLHQQVTEDFRKEMKHNIDVLGRSLNLQPPDAALFVNGLFFDADTLEIGALHETLRSELRVLNGLYNLNIEGKLASDLLALDLSSSGGKEFAIDIRDSAIMWINDLENDKQYRRWPDSIMDLLRPSFPGMLRNVRKNLFNLVLLVDPITPDSRGLIKLAESFVIHLAPVRLGLVFDSRNAPAGDKDEDYRSILCAFNYVTQQKSGRDALGFLTDVFAATRSNEDITSKTIHSELKRAFSKLSASEINDILGEDSDFDYGRQISTEFLDRLGFRSSPQALINGVPLQQSQLNTDDFEETILTEIMQQTPNIQKAVYKGDLSDSDNVLDYLMDMPHIMPRLNQRILKTDEPTFLDVSGNAHNDLSNVKSLAQLSHRDMTATLMSNIKYFYSKHTPEKLNGNSVYFLTLWVIGDLETEIGAQMLRNALTYMKSSGGLRVAFIPNTEGASVSSKDNLNRLALAASQSLDGIEATNVVLKWLENRKSKTRDVPKPVKDLLSATELHLKMLRVYCARVLKLKTSENAVIANGNVIGPLDENEVFTTDDYGLIERFSSHTYSDKIKKMLQGSTDEELNVDSDVILKLFTILVPRQQSRTRFAIPSDIQDNYTAVKLPHKSANVPFFDIFAVLDPASRGAQKLAPILILLRNIVNCNMRVLLCAVDKHSDMPVKNFYRYVIEPELQFGPDGKSTPGPYAKFTGLPAGPLLTQNLQVPENWLVEVVRSVYDLDNIKLIDINGPVHSEYELEHLLLEGHCFDSTSGAPPRGLQFTLGTKETPVVVDTIVMANLGYFQLKANPGAWTLKLRAGKSSEIYDVTSADGPNTIHGPEETRVIISSLRSHVLKIRVTKKPGQANADLLSDDSDVQTGIWDSITSSFSGSSDPQTPEVINIFSVASGHLYERLLRIMMLSLLKHTQSPVKFWFLKNYLSPQFVDFLPHMAAEYNFQYELVQYKWPRWLHQQTEKQRTIWGYKILFLDVLFPLDVKKIIFVDADAIVRADIKELNDLDLNNAPYAYTPFCDSRTEMEGFRFWKQGYWRNHLQGRKYHISALYVVDLKRFRKVAAGDRLRGQYQALSQDPNSLSNLDQDLPNNMIHQVAIKSLPQEWLWCQTWCNDEGLATAKTIDLCNNPLTKEAKLTAAQRIVPEWKDYDQEIKNLLVKVELGEVEHEEEVNSETVKEEADRKDIHSEL